MAKSLIPKSKLNRARFYNKIAGWITHKAGSPAVSISAFLVIILWAISGPLFNFSDTWQLVINTGTTIITFLMVFIIQQSQNKDTGYLFRLFSIPKTTLDSSDTSINKIIYKQFYSTDYCIHQQCILHCRLNFHRIRFNGFQTITSLVFTGDFFHYLIPVTDIFKILR